MRLYQNYHKHTHYTNPLISDSIATYEDYARRAKELGHQIISSCEHGYQGRYIECYNLAKQYGLKFLFAAEAYWVIDRTTKDDTNCHIILTALNESGRRDITRILSEANKTGFYSRPRVDIELLLSLNPSNVIITTACVAFWKYDDIDDILLRLWKHFGNHLFLEVQYHNTPAQQQLNAHIRDLHRQYQIPLIMGCDSHYIEEQADKNRTDFLVSKGINYPDEEGWYLDYPDGDTAYRRFVDQGVLSGAEIESAIENTNIFLQVEEYDSPIFNKEVKLPSIYPNWTQSERDAEYQRLVMAKWDEYKQEVPPVKHQLYKQEIKKEIDSVIECHMSDYFLTNYYIIKRGKEKGGVLTSTGRGSAVSFITNKLLGFTEVDRIVAQVTMYPERFMTATRILESGSMPDIDFNIGTLAPFEEAQKEILGDKHAYPMIAYGTMKKSGAWKMYAKANNVSFETANAVSKQIKRYEDALKYAEEDERDSIFIENYIDAQYLDIYRGSEAYLSTIVSWSPAPSAFLLYAGDIEEEIGLIRIGGKLCCLMDGHWAEENSFLKNDLLQVTVVKVIDETFREIGIPRMSVSELLRACPSTDRAWDTYKKACTLGVNQVEQPGTSARVATFAPKNISDLCAFIAAIRPGFKSMYKIFESRKPFKYGIASFDQLIQTEYMPNSFVLYQEQVMATLNYAGIPMTECYTAIKNISKKRVEKVIALKNTFMDGFIKILQDNEHLSNVEAVEAAEKVWQIIDDSSHYSFNASHAYCVALDSLYCAWLKQHYPLQFYGAYIRIMTEGGKKKKAQAAQAEAQSYFRIKFPPFRFGQDNSKIAVDVDARSIYMPLQSIKNFNAKTAVLLSEIRDKKYTYFSDLLMELRPYSVTEKVTKQLTYIDYFDQFGNQRELLSIINMCVDFGYGEKSTIRQANLDVSPWKDIILAHSTNIGVRGNVLKTYTFTSCIDIIHAAEDAIKQKGMQDLDLKVKIQNQLDALGYISVQTNKECDRRLLVVLEIFPLLSKTTQEPWAYAINTQSIGSGVRGHMTIKASVYDRQPLQAHSIIYADNVTKNYKGYWYLNKYTLRG